MFVKSCELFGSREEVAVVTRNLDYVLVSVYDDETLEFEIRHYKERLKDFARLKVLARNVWSMLNHDPIGSGDIAEAISLFHLLRE